MKRKAHTVASVEIPKVIHRDDWQSSQNGAEQPNDDENDHGSPGFDSLEAVRVDDDEVALERNKRERQDGDLAGDHAEETWDLAGVAGEPLHRKLVVSVSELNVLGTDDQQIDSHQ